MDSNQLAKMIEWLDEERRRDKTVITTLEERLAQQDETINQLQRRLNGIESDQTVMREASVPIQKERDMLDQLRQEMRQMLEASEARRLTAERESERRQELNREGIQRTLRDLQDGLDKLQRSTSPLPEVRKESDRLADQLKVLQQRVDDLAKKFESPERRLTFLEEQRRQDARRVSDVETEFPELRKQIDAIKPKLTLIEDLSIRNERRIQESQNTERERRDQMQQFIDSQTLLLQQRDQKIEDLQKRFADHDEVMARNSERFEVWSSTHRDMKRVIDDFERISERLESRINEVAEMQRLSEERFRDEWNNWRDDEQKRWKQLTLSNDEVWRNHDREFEQYVETVNELRTSIAPLANSIQRLWSLERERAQLYRERYQSLLLQYDDPNEAASQAVASSTNGNNTYSNGGNGHNGNGY